MISSLTIENFRGIKNLHLTDLARINVIVGPNSSGKTAVLEAITLGCRASPTSALQMWQERGRSNLAAAGAPGFRSVWSGFFHNLDFSKPITIKYVDSDIGRRALRIVADNGTTQTILQKGSSVKVEQAPLDDSVVASITFERTINRAGSIEKARSYVGPQGQLMADNANPIGAACAMFSAFSPANESDNATWLSQLSLKNREKEALKLLQSEFPYITGLDILAPAGLQGIYVAQKGENHKLPIGLISSGIQKVLSLVLASLSYEKGIILVDEIENGIFYRRYGDVWSLLRTMSEQYTNQIFVSSHSLECLQAAAPIVKTCPSDFALIRIEEGSDGPIARKFSGIEFAAAIEQGVDPRGREPKL